MSIPVFAISNLFLKEVGFFILDSPVIINKMMLEKSTLYQTNNPSLSVISFPKIPVKPASITAMCNSIYNLFIKELFPLLYQARFLLLIFNPDLKCTKIASSISLLIPKLHFFDETSMHIITLKKMIKSELPPAKIFKRSRRFRFAQLSYDTFEINNLDHMKY